MRSRLISALMVMSLTAGCAGTTPGVSPTPTVSRPAPSAPLAPPSTPGPSATLAPVEIPLARANVPRAPATEADATSAATAINAFAFDLHRALATGDDNLVFSPTSIAIALGMARAGARGETAAQMDEVLRSVASDENANWLNSLDQALARRSGTFRDADDTVHEVTLDITNAHFLQRDLPFEDAYLEALATRFGAGLNLVDFARDPEAARALINAWANAITRGRIPDVLKPGDVSENTVFALANAIYLKAPWLQPFREHETEDGAFERPDGSTVDVPMMEGGTGRCATGTGWEAMDLPYLGGSLSMLVIVPDDLTAFERTLEPAVVAGIDRAFGDEEAVLLSLPRFEFETRADLVAILTALGMPDAFDERADFSGMTRAARLAITKVIHQANITVDEKGTEAAAVTVVIGDVSGPPPPTCTVRADRSFLFAIRDRETGSILFLGRVVDPS